MMQAIATLVQDDPYLKLSKEQRIAARRARRAKFRSKRPKKVIVAVEQPTSFRCEMRPHFQMQFVTIPKPTYPLIEDIQSVVRKEYGFTKAEFLADRRTGPIVRARHISMYLAKKLTLRSLPEIGRRFGRDHTTILHGIRKVECLMKTDAVLTAEIAGLEAVILEAIA